MCHLPPWPLPFRFCTKDLNHYRADWFISEKRLLSRKSFFFFSVIVVQLATHVSSFFPSQGGIINERTLLRPIDFAKPSERSKLWPTQVWKSPMSSFLTHATRQYCSIWQVLKNSCYTSWQFPYLQNNRASFKRGGGAEERNNINFSPPLFTPKGAFYSVPRPLPPFQPRPKNRIYEHPQCPKKRGLEGVREGGISQQEGFFFEGCDLRTN